MDETPNLALPYLSPSQAQKHVTHNEALRALDALLQLSVPDQNVVAPPPAPSEGDRYLVAASPTGAFAGKADQIAAWQDGTWAFYPPREGWLVFVQTDNALLAFVNGVWTTVSGPNAVAAVSKLGVNTTPTGPNRVAVKTDAALFSHDDVTPGSGDVRLALNKKAGRIASILFQSDYQTRAELALTDANGLALRTSADGVVFRDVLGIDPATGTVALAVKTTTAARAYIIDPIRLGVASSGHMGALAGDAQKTWTGTANTASRDLVIGGGAAFADLGTHPFLCVEDYGAQWPRRFNVALGVTLTRRGLRGVKLVISDAHQGLKAAIARVLSATWQRCRVHFMRNALAHAGKSGRRVVSAFTATAFAQDHAAAAKAQWRQVADQLRPKLPKLSALLDETETDVLAYMDFPKDHRAKLHSVNPLERLNGEIKRRTDVVGIFPNEAALVRLVGAILLEQNDDWAVQRARYMTLETIAPLSDDGLVLLPAVPA